jgi:hypothetical protein
MAAATKSSTKLALDEAAVAANRVDATASAVRIVFIPLTPFDPAPK